MEESTGDSYQRSICFSRITLPGRYLWQHCIITDHYQNVFNGRQAPHNYLVSRQYAQ